MLSAVSELTNKLYQYVGPAEIRAAIDHGRGTAIECAADLATWVRAQNEGHQLIATYVLDDQRTLRVAPRRSEHVACAGGQPVYAAGELEATAEGDVVAVSNQSTGYCPDPSCWLELEAALEAASLVHPGRFTVEITFRRCPECGQRNIVKDNWFECDVCGAALPTAWNFA